MPQHVVGLTVFSSEMCFWNHLLSRNADTESTLKSEHSDGLGLDIGNFPQGVSKFTGPFYIAFYNFVTEPEVRRFIKVGVVVFRRELF